MKGRSLMAPALFLGNDVAPSERHRRSKGDCPAAGLVTHLQFLLRGLLGTQEPPPLVGDSVLAGSPIKSSRLGEPVPNSVLRSLVAAARR